MTTIYFPTEIFTKIMGYCGESYEEKRDRLWKSIKPLKFLWLEDESVEDLEFLSVYDTTRGKTLEWCLGVSTRTFDGWVPSAESGIETDLEQWCIDDNIACWTKEEDFDVDDPNYRVLQFL